MLDRESATKIVVRGSDPMSATLTLACCINLGQVCVEIPMQGTSYQIAMAKKLQEALPPVDGLSMGCSGGRYVVRTRFERISELMEHLRRLHFYCREQEPPTGLRGRTSGK